MFLIEILAKLIYFAIFSTEPPHRKFLKTIAINLAKMLEILTRKDSKNITPEERDEILNRDVKNISELVNSFKTQYAAVIEAATKQFQGKAIDTSGPPKKGVLVFCNGQLVKTYEGVHPYDVPEDDIRGIENHFGRMCYRISVGWS